MLTLAEGPPVSGQDPVRRQREQIGEVLGKPVYRDQISIGKNADLESELYRLFVAPVMEKYCREHRAETTPTEAEIEAATIYFDKWHREQIREEEPKLRRQLQTIKAQLARPALKQQEREKLEIEAMVIETQLKPPGRHFAHFILDNWKLQRHLYDRFGDGRLLWQQAGTEAFDAMRKWLETQERNGSFKIVDPKLRAEIYEYYNRSHVPFLISDKERIRKEFLEPEWATARRLSK
jgi:hypothetical protein